MKEPKSKLKVRATITNDNQTKRRYVVPLLAVALTVILALGIVPKAQATATVSFTINASKSASPGLLSPYLNANRQGVLALKANQGDYNPNGYYFTATNTQIVTLYTNAGVRFFSIGGTGTDTGYPPNSTNDLGNFFSFAQAANLQVNFLLGMSNTISGGTMAYTNYDETNLLFLVQNYSNNVLFESIGNERDALTSDSDPGWGYSWTGFTQFWPYWKSYYDDLVNYLQANGAPVPYFGGPDAITGQPLWAEWFGATNQSVYGANDNIYELNMHYHVFSHGTNDTGFEDALNMLSSNVDDTYFPQNEGLLTYTLQNGSGLFNYAAITEFNAYPFDPPNLAGNTGNGYANALFALDAMHWWAQEGLWSLCWLDGPGAFFFIDENGNGVPEAAPILYGCAAYNLGGGADAANPNMDGGWIAPITAWSNPSGVNNATAYAVADYGADGNCTNLYVTIINTSMTSPPSGRWQTNFLADFTVGMPYGNTNKPTAIHRIVLQQAQNYVTATNGITLGGADLNGAGPFQPQWVNLGILNYSFFKATVTNLTAQIIEFSCPKN